MNEMYCIDCLLLRHSEMLIRAARYSWPKSRCRDGDTSSDFVHRHAFAVVQQGDRQVIGHALLVVGEQHVPLVERLILPSVCRCFTASRLKPTKSRAPSGTRRASR